MDSALNLTALTVAWGVITQCLTWGNVIAWPLVAIWGPFGIALVLAFIAAIILAVWGD